MPKQNSLPKRVRDPKYKRQTSVGGRVADWEAWRERLVGNDEETLNALGRGKGCPTSVNLLQLKYVPLPAQYRFHASNKKFRGYSGAVGCVAGETRLDGSHAHLTIAELCQLEIAPIVNTLLGPVQAKVPYLKGRAALYEVRLSTGESMLTTLDHLLFARNKQPWQPVRFLSVGDYILRAQPLSSPASVSEIPLCQLPTNWVPSPSRSPQDEPHSNYIEIDSMGHYSASQPTPLLCGEQLLQGSDTAQEQIPSPDGARGHSHFYCMDDPVYIFEHIRSYQPFCPHSSTDDQTQLHRYDSLYEPYKEFWNPGYKISEFCYRLLFEHISSSGKHFQNTVGQLSRDFSHKLNQSLGSFSDYTISWGQIASIKFCRIDDFYDLGVPEAQHYISCGILSHNSGKSKALAYESLYQSAINPNCIGYITAPTQTMLQGAAQTAIMEMLQTEGIAYTHKGGQQDTITFMPGDPNFDSTNGILKPSQIVFRTASNAERLRGPNIAWFGMDEMTYSDEEAWKILVGRIREPRATMHTGFGCWTPKGMDWVYNLFIKPGVVRPDFEMTYSRPGENYHLDPDFYSTLMSQYDANFAKQEVEGAYLNVYQGHVYHSYDQKENVQLVNYVPGVPINWTLDFNVKPFCSVILQSVDGPHQAKAGRAVIKPWDEIWAIDEIVLDDSNTYAMCEAFGKRTEKWLQLNKNRIVVNLYGDATGARRQTSAHASDWQIIKDWFIEHSDQYMVHWHVAVDGHEQNPPVRARVAAVNAALCDAHSIRRLKIDPRCKILLNDLQMVSWIKGDEGINMDSGKKRELTHISDALGYFVVDGAGYFQTMDYVRRRMPGF